MSYENKEENELKREMRMKGRGKSITFARKQNGQKRNSKFKL
jgi:hypothetical protein